MLVNKPALNEAMKLARQLEGRIINIYSRNPKETSLLIAVSRLVTSNEISGRARRYR